jgi:hypothetical protein
MRHRRRRAAQVTRMARWDFLYDLSPRPAIDLLLDEAAKALGDELRRWPPGVDEVADPALAPVLAGPPPHPLARREGFRLARWDLERAYEEIERWQEAGWRSAQLSEDDRKVALFLWRYLTEWAFGLAEVVRTPLARSQLVDLLERTERRLAA